MRGILRYIFVPWRKDERNFSIVHTDLLMYIVIKFRMRYNIIKDLWLYEPRIISNYWWFRIYKRDLDSKMLKIEDLFECHLERPITAKTQCYLL